MTDFTRAVLQHWGYDDRHIILNVLLPFIEAVEALFEEGDNVGFFEFDNGNVEEFGKCLFHLDEKQSLCRRFHDRMTELEIISHAPLMVDLFGNTDRRYVLVCKKK